MLFRFFQNSWVKFAASSLLLIITLWCVIRPEYYFLQTGISYAQYILIGEVVLGVAFLLLRQPPLSFIAFGCSALLCLFLKFNTNYLVRIPVNNNQPIFTIAHFNLANGDPDPEVTFSTIGSSNADLITVQEVTPLWDSLLHVTLKEVYPYNYQLIDIGLYGMSVYSRTPILKLDTFYYHNIPNIIGEVEHPDDRGQPINFILSHTMPALSSESFGHLQKHLSLLAKKCNAIKRPLVTIGQYNAVTWSNEIQNFRERSRLSDSRQLTRTQLNGGIPPFFDISDDYIFYSRHFNCLRFETLTSEEVSHIGIKTILQYKKTKRSNEE